MNNSGFSQDNSPYITITEFTESALLDFQDHFFRLEQSDIPIIAIYISSYGGEVTAMNAMRDLIKSSNKPVATIALGKAMSAGLFLLASGTKGYRFAAPNSSIMFHELRGGGGGKVSEVTLDAVEMEKIHKRLFKNFSEDTSKSVNFWHDKNSSNRNHDLHLTAQEAKDLDIVDHVFLPRIGVQPHQYYLTMPEEVEVEPNINAEFTYTLEKSTKKKKKKVAKKQQKAEKVTKKPVKRRKKQ